MLWWWLLQYSYEKRSIYLIHGSVGLPWISACIRWRTNLTLMCRWEGWGRTWGVKVPPSGDTVIMDHNQIWPGHSVGLSQRITATNDAPHKHCYLCQQAPHQQNTITLLGLIVNKVWDRHCLLQWVHMCHQQNAITLPGLIGNKVWGRHWLLQWVHMCVINRIPSHCQAW